MTIAITGSTGAIGSALIPALEAQGHPVIKLVRGQPKSADEIAWNVETGEIDSSALGGVDAIIHLAGKNIATRWTKSAKREIRASRVDATRKLCERLAKFDPKPRTLISASAVGYYGDRGEEVLTEASPPGDGWMETLCVDWERATDPARDAGIRVVNLRTAVVLSRGHGALAKLLTPARLGLTGRVGTGEQWMPWIALADQVRVIATALARDDFSGPINPVTDSVRQIDFIRTLARILHRPAFLPMPRAMVNVLFGEMGRSTLLTSMRVEPAKLKAAGFEWSFPSLEGALRAELDRASQGRRLR